MMEIYSQCTVLHHPHIALSTRLGFPKPPTYLAGALPAASDVLRNDYHHNAYRRSFFYDHAAKALHVRSSVRKGKKRKKSFYFNGRALWCTEIARRGPRE